MILPTLHLRIERWKFNKEYGVYVSTLGNFKDRHKRRLPFKLKDGYCYVQTETASWKSAHRLVMLTWRPIPDAEELTVDHLNHNKRDNSIYNLEWVTKEENLKRAERDQLNLKKQKISTIQDGENKYIIIDQEACKAEKARKKAERLAKIEGYSIDGEGCYTKNEAIEKLVAMRGKDSRKLTIKAFKCLENGTNQEGRKVFGKHSVKHVVEIVWKENSND